MNVGAISKSAPRRCHWPSTAQLVTGWGRRIVARVAGVARVAEGAGVARLALVVRLARVALVAGLALVVRLARMAGVAGLVLVAGVRASQVATDSSEARVAG